MYRYNFFEWLKHETKTKWWVDTADPDEVLKGLDQNALGVTANPLLLNLMLKNRPDLLDIIKKEIMEDAVDTNDMAEIMTKKVSCMIADLIMPVFEISGSKSGYVCAQTDPSKALDPEYMYESAKRFHTWRPNIAVKLPCTAPGLEVLEQCVSEGITITATVSFTVSQLIHIAEHYQKGIYKAAKNSLVPGKCFAVIMLGRLDDYLRDISVVNKANISESDISQAGIACVKNAYEIYTKRGYMAELMVSGMRGTHHMTEIAGGDLILSIHPQYQSAAMSMKGPWESRISHPVDDNIINRLKTLPEFIKAYDPEGMKPNEFASYGAVQRTLIQFTGSGWDKLGSYL